jgi:hypothetical protein
MLEVLLAEPLHGNEELRRQIPALLVSETHVGCCPTARFTVDALAAAPAPVTGMALVDAYWRDTDDMEIVVHLHVVDGYLWELEVYRADGGETQRELDPAALTIGFPGLIVAGPGGTETQASGSTDSPALE